MNYTRIIAIADLHGCLNEFNELLDKIKPKKEEDLLIVLGDYIDRGYDSEGVIHQLIELKDTVGEDRVICLLGNHEDTVVQNAKKKVLFKKNKFPYQQYAGLFQKMPLLYETEECIFVHAGFDGNMNNRKCLLEDTSVLNGKRIYDGKLYIAGHSPFFSGTVKPFDQPVYIDINGKHHIVKTGMKLPEKGAMFIDTGCAYKNRLTSVIIDSKKTIQLESVNFIGKE